MSAFLHPGLAWAGLALMSVPILIHLINRRRLRRLDWAAMEFLLLALKKNRRRIRLEQLILLLCRMGLMALLGFTLARPLLSERGFGWLGGALRSEERIFVLDDSLSMAARSGASSSFERAIESMTTALRRLAESRSRDRLTILLGSRLEAPLVRRSLLDRERAEELARALEALQPADTALRLDACFEAAAEILQGGGAETRERPASVTLFSDLRVRDWTDSKGAASSALAEALARLAGIGAEPPRIEVVDCGVPVERNVSVSAIELEGGRPTVGLPAEFRVSVRNYGPEPAGGLRIELSYAPAGREGVAPSSALAPPLETVPPGGSAVAAVSAGFQNEGPYWIRATSSGARDPLPDDDVLYLGLDVVEATEVLLVDGEPKADVWDSETFLLASALDPGGDGSWGIRPFVVSETSLPREALDRYGAVFLANVYTLPEDFRRSLARYVRTGGALVIFLGDQVDPALAVRELGLAGEDGGLLPARIGEVRNHDERPVPLLPVLDHEFFRSLPEGIEAHFEALRFRRFFALEPVGTARVFARFGDEDRSPALLEADVGRGRVILCASSADLEWSDWPPNPTYPMFLQEMMARLGWQRARSNTYLTGAPIEIPIEAAGYKLEALYRDPRYPETPERRITASPRGEEGAFVLRIADSRHAGVAVLGLERRDGTREWRPLAIRPPPDESDLRRVAASRLASLYPDAGIVVLADRSGAVEAGRGRFEGSDICLVLLVLLLLLEGTLALIFAHHRRDTQAAPVAGGAA